MNVSRIEHKGKRENVLSQLENIRNVVLPSEDFQVFDFKKLKATGRFGCFTVRSGDRVVGYIAFEVFPRLREVVVHSFAVLPMFQGRGLGSQLLESMLCCLKAKGYSKVCVTTTETSTGYRALELFVKHGFHVKRLGKAWWEFWRNDKEVDLEYVVGG